MMRMEIFVISVGLNVFGVIKVIYMINVNSVILIMIGMK